MRKLDRCDLLGSNMQAQPQISNGTILCYTRVATVNVLWTITTIMHKPANEAYVLYSPIEDTLDSIHAAVSVFRNTRTCMLCRYSHTPCYVLMFIDWYCCTQQKIKQFNTVHKCFQFSLCNSALYIWISIHHQ